MGSGVCAHGQALYPGACAECDLLAAVDATAADVPQVIIAVRRVADVPREEAEAAGCLGGYYCAGCAAEVWASAPTREQVGAHDVDLLCDPCVRRVMPGVAHALTTMAAEASRPDGWPFRP
jgi:hypothetical protein